MSSELTAKFAQDYAALTAGCGLVDLSRRTQLEFTGADRAKFLHNLCTNAVQNLAVGSGCEAFVLNVKGHIVGHLSIFAAPDSHIMETVPEQAEKLSAHFERYLIREDVQIHDRSLQRSEMLLSGPRSASILNEICQGKQLELPKNRLDHIVAKIADVTIWIRRVDWTGQDAFLIACERTALPDVRQSLMTAGAALCEESALEAARIENGIPWFGRDITEQNLPQEINRDRLAISFTKGCYLGQETVARIDALGHVNRLLRGVRFNSDTLPKPGLQLGTEPGAKPVGHVTSACWSPKLNGSLALAFVNRGHDEAGTQLNSEIGPAQIVELPLAAI